MHNLKDYATKMATCGKSKQNQSASSVKSAIQTSKLSNSQVVRILEKETWEKKHNQKRAEADYKHRFAENKKADYERAIADFTKAIELDPEDVLAYNNRGIVYYYKGRFYRTVDDFSTVISLTPDDPFAYYGRGMAYRNLLVFEKSIQDFSTAIRLKPEAAADAYTQRGVTYHSKGDVDHAIEDYNAAIALDPQFAEAWIRGAG